MESFRFRYNKLFSINFLHPSYGLLLHNSIADDIKIQPDKQTEELFRNLMIGNKLLDNKYICFIRCDLLNPPDEELRNPFLEISKNYRFRFIIQAGSVFFKNTIIEVAGSKQIYHFSNRDNIGTNNFITRHEEGVNSDDLSDSATVKADENCLAVIDIYSDGAININYELFDGSVQKLKSPVYQVRFKNQN